MKSLPALTARNNFTQAPYRIIYTHACTSAHKRTGCHCILDWMCECQNHSVRGSNNRERLSIWGGCKERYELLPLWVDWHIWSFPSLCVSNMLYLHEWAMAIIKDAYVIKQHVNILQWKIGRMCEEHTWNLWYINRNRSSRNCILTKNIQCRTYNEQYIQTHIYVLYRGTVFWHTSYILQS